MHEHDLDLIMALAEGTLDASDVPSAEAAVAACAECSGDLELQRLALSALEAAPPVAMTEMESAQMRRTLRHELGLVPATKPAKAQRRWFPIGALASAAALLVALVVIGPGLELLGPGGDDSGGAEVAAFSATSTTSAAAEADDGTTAGEGRAPEPGTNLDALEEAAADLTTTTRGAPETTLAPAEPTTTAPSAAQASSMQFSAQPDLATLEEAVISLGITADTDLAQLEEQLRALGIAFELTTTGRAAYTQECLAAGVGSIEGASSGFALGEAPYGLADVMVAVYETAAPDDVVVAVQDTTTCEVLETSP